MIQTLSKVDGFDIFLAVFSLTILLCLLNLIFFSNKIVLTIPVYSYIILYVYYFSGEPALDCRSYSRSIFFFKKKKINKAFELNKVIRGSKRDGIIFN